MTVDTITKIVINVPLFIGLMIVSLTMVSFIFCLISRDEK
jgi:hypothetical protein